LDSDSTLNKWKKDPKSTRLDKDKLYRLSYLILADIIGKFHDIRKLQNELPKIYSLNDYSQSQALVSNLRQQDSYRIVYSSVRHLNGECIAVFRPPVIANVRTGEHVVFQWNGQTIIGYYKRSDYHQL